MCGIVGAVNGGQFTPEEVLKSLGHRGPDSQGSITLDNVFLGHTRLSIIDLSVKGSQPMFSKDGNYIIVFNGEIYNHLDLRKELQEYDFNSTSDTETVLYSYIKYGKDCLNKLNGIFAIAIYNKLEESVFIARDQFGVKPLYYSNSNNRFVFSSEIKSLNVLGIDHTLDFYALKNYLTFMWSPGELTPYKAVKKLKPGHYLTVKIRPSLQVDIQKYYQIPFEGSYFKKPEKKWIDDVEEELFNAVKRQMMSDVPVGFFLSGGLDSSLLVAMAKKHLPGRDLKCFTIDTGEHANKGVCSRFILCKTSSGNLTSRFRNYQSKVRRENEFDRMIYHLDEPQADPAPLNVLNICKLAKEQGIKVLIGGVAGDDIFSGYRRHQSLQLEKLYSLLPLFSRRILSNIGATIPVSNYQLYRLKKLLSQSSKNLQDRFNGYFNVQSPQFCGFFVSR
jgi:asparagine synthase (glutamine-hydrolysing)